MEELKTALYLRVSTNKQSKGLEAQRYALLEYCRSKDIKDYIIFADENISGSKDSRPALDKLINEVHKGTISSVICYSFSRFARSTVHLLNALEDFKKHNVNFISLTENIDTGTPIGKVVFTIVSAIAELERELIAERVRNGLKNAKIKGKILGRRKTRNSALIRELRTQGLTYRRISELCGSSITTICRELKLNVS